MFELIGGIQSVQLDDARRPQQLRAEERERERDRVHTEPDTSDVGRVPTVGSYREFSFELNQRLISIFGTA